MKQVDKSSGDTCPSAATHLLGARSTPKTYQSIGQASKVNQGPISPEVQANFIEDWTLWWLNDLFRLGFKRQIQEQDLYQIMESRRANVLGQLLYDNWEMEKTNARIKNRVPSLLRALIRSFWNEYLPGYICLEIGDACLVCMPLVLRMDSQMMDPPPPAIKGFGLAFGMFSISLTMSILFQRWSVCSLKTGIFIRTSLIDLVFKKATTISAKSRLLYPDGSIINLMSTDISRIDSAMVPLLISIAAPINITVIMVFLIRLMGASALLGAFMLMLSNPVQAWGLSKLGPVRKQASQFTDSRISFLAKLSEIRSKELGLVCRILRNRGFITATSGAIPVLASAMSFVMYAALGNELKPEIVFPALAFYALMRVPLLILPNCYTASVDAYVAMIRIQEFLLSEDYVNGINLNENAEEAISIHDGNFIWETLPTASLSASAESSSTSGSKVRVDDSKASIRSLEQDQRTLPYLKDINVKIARGSLVAVVGPVGSGKSSLLQAMVGNMTKGGGTVIRGTSISYASQTPWIQNATIRDNILFDTEFEEERYWRVIRACSLEKDLVLFPGGDMTEIGERGINLSGGQKARLSLARSVYFNAGMVVMDDPLSAVDAHVGKRLWKDSIMGELKGKTRVIATHQLHVLPDVDYVICMKDGKIAAQGTYQELLEQNGDFMELMTQYGGMNRKKPLGGAVGGQVESDAESSSTAQQNQKSAWNMDFDQMSEVSGETDGEEQTGGAHTDKSTGVSKLITEEEREIGAVSLGVYGEYFKMVGPGLWVAVVFCYIIQQVCNVMMNYWLSLWSNQTLGLPVSTNIAVYISFAICQFIIVATASVLLSFAIIGTTEKMHSKAFDKVIHAPMSFFDTTPIGRIINRFSKDVDSLDNVLWGTLNDIFITSLIVLGAVSLTIAYFPYLILAIVPMAAMYYGGSVYYRSTSREVKRLDSNLRSVLYAHFAESLSGMGTLRAYNRIDNAISVNQQKLDLSNRAYYLFQVGARWISFRTQFLGSLLALMASLFAVGFRNSIDAATAGLILSSLVRTSGDMSYLVQCTAALENNMNSTERLVHYTKNLPQEPPTESRPGLEPEPLWPEQGAISFNNVSLRYRPDLPLVLRNISFDIKSGLKVAVVGRTGAGKSSLIQALFLLTDLESGQVIIDGIDTQTIGTADLRSHIAIIPQDPVLFHGTFRYNLDPLGKYSEQELWDVLGTSELKAYVQAQDGKLDAMVSVNGENLSVGQRQLVCLSRALLAKSKIVVLDEATASVDLATDALIQKAIRVDFAGSTVVTIAHRLNTIIDYDRILVMDQGQIAEYDTPFNLLNNPISAFSELVAETGDQNAAHLRSLAGL
ncbi:hypothetical protein BGX21_001195 [Mortierella sp. AD011]|nr:hypothetical protein BGX20_004725 [Mortierella sp. AD010]KAF9401607.1 hypothetical protein BGX21_001195 [Mortierella sp. AD011]